MMCAMILADDSLWSESFFFSLETPTTYYLRSFGGFEDFMGSVFIADGKRPTVCPEGM